MRRAATMLIVVLLLALTPAKAQDVPPPPKPKDDGPSLEATMKFIQDKLNGQGKINYVSTRHDSKKNTIDEGRSIANTMSGVEADPAACKFSANTLSQAPGTRRDRRLEFSFREIEKLAVSSWADTLNRKNAEQGHPELTFEFAPAVFALTLQMQDGKRVRGHGHIARDGQQTQDNDESLAWLELFFREEELAQRVAKAMLHAVELCGGGNKDPF